MSWQLCVQSAEAMLNEPRIPSSQEIINLIKRVNPTKLCLSDQDRQRGYEIKGKLQNLLLENYGEVFHLDPHPYSDKYILIKHSALPSVDACHAELASLSTKALDTVASSSVKPQEKKARQRKPNGKDEAPAEGSPREALKTAQALLDRFEYAEAEEVLSGIRIAGVDELGTLEKAARIMIEEMGAYERAIETLLAQPKQVVREASVRELLAVTYHHNGKVPEARAVFDSLHPAELGKDALYAWADIALKDDNLSLAYNLLTVADDKDGFVTAFVTLRSEIESRMLAEAEPAMQQAAAALERGDLPEAAALAREALARCPNHQKAREIVGIMESSREAAEIAGLWEGLARAQRCEARLDLLARLLERDAGNEEKIRRLIACEKAKRRREQVDARLDELRTLAAAANWRESFDIVLWLSRQEDLGDEYRAACAGSPYLSVLYQNKAIQRLPERSAKELWLRFIEVKTELQSGLEVSFEAMEAIKPYFHPYPEFADDYRAQLRLEQDRAREEIRELLQRLKDDDCTLQQGERIAGTIRRRTAVLPEDERAAHHRAVETRLEVLRPAVTDEALLKEYRDARLLGFTEKADLIREQIVDKAPLFRIDTLIDRWFRIEAEPLDFSISKDPGKVKLLPKPKLEWQWQTDRHIVLKDDDAWIVVNLEEASATRYVFPEIKKARFIDAIPQSNTFLIKDERNRRSMWRAELAGGKGVFTAMFDGWKVGPEGWFAGLCYLSSDRVTDYYALMVDSFDRPGKVARQRLTSRKSVTDAIEIGPCKKPFLQRLTSEPDRFIIGWEKETRICNRSLTTECAVEMTPIIWEVDPVNERIYYFYSNMLKKVDFGFHKYEEFPGAHYCFFFKDNHTILGLSPETDTVMVAIGNKAALYNYRDHRMSEPFRRGRVICTRPARRWYCYDYDKERRKLTLTDITDELQTLLKREDCVVLVGDERAEAEMETRMTAATGQMFLGYRPGERPPWRHPRKPYYKRLYEKRSAIGRPPEPAAATLGDLPAEAGLRQRRRRFREFIISSLQKGRSNRNHRRGYGSESRVGGKGPGTRGAAEHGAVPARARSRRQRSRLRAV